MMKDKSFLIEKVVKILLRKNYSLLFSNSCFDIAAKRKDLLLLKVLLNADSFLKRHAESLKVLSYFLSAKPFLISERDSRGYLDDCVFYFRFGIPVVTLKLFEEIISDKTTSIIACKGGRKVSIDVKLLKEMRMKSGMSLRRLSEKLGISKKALYEIESEKVEPSLDTVEKLEEIFKISLRKPYKPNIEPMVIKPTDSFQLKIYKKLGEIGIRSSSTRSELFELIGQSSFRIFIKIVRNEGEMKNYSEELKKASDFFSTKSFLVPKKKISTDYGIPVVTKDRLMSISSAKELYNTIS